MRVLVVGSGGREHALVWKIARSESVTEVLAAPGSDAMAADARCLSGIGVSDADALLAAIRSESVDLVVIGPEAPLAAGMSDRLRDAGVAVFGPSADAARIESSKAWAKDFMARHRIPTAAYEVFHDESAALRHVASMAGCVVKADGLAAGKGVAVCADADAASRAIREMMGDRRFGDAGATVVIEECLVGEEASYYVLTDGEHVMPLTAAQDHKRAEDGDRGENTGGMGAYSPAPIFSEAVEKRVLEEVVHPLVRGMAAEGHPYSGVLYVGLMIDASGSPRVVEFNARFGDPETQALVLRMEGDLVPLLAASARGGLDRESPPAWRDAAVCVVLASGGYPREYTTGVPIEGLEDAAKRPDVVVFHAGTRCRDDGRFETAGGRVLGVTARGASVAEARERAYTAADRIRFDGRILRRDIAARAIRP